MGSMPRRKQDSTERGLLGISAYSGAVGSAKNKDEQTAVSRQASMDMRQARSA